MTDPQSTQIEREKAHVERINHISDMARTSWLALLGYLAFIVITLLGVADADFFLHTRQTRLPLVGVEIPTVSFFAIAPVLCVALYIYLHKHLEELWDAIGDARNAIGIQRLGERIHPWHVNDLALTLAGAKGTPPRPSLGFNNLATRVLVWVAAPGVLLAFWWQSMPAHSWPLTVWLGCRCFCHSTLA